MKAVGYRKSLPISEPDALIDVELPAPTPGPRDLLVSVKAVSVNPVDTKMRKRSEPQEGGVAVLGWDAAGVVEAVGAEVSLFKKGDAVFYAGAIDRPGANAELHLVDERIVGRKPLSLSFEQAAALPLTAITAWELLFDRLGVAPSKKPGAGNLLIIGGAGGVGSMLIQLARRLTSLTVIATASRPETVKWCLDLGAHHVINHAKPLADELKDIGLQEVDMIALLAGTDQHLPALPGIMRPQSKLGAIENVAQFDIMPFMQKSISVHWELMFTRPLFHTPDIAAQHDLLNEVSALVDEGVLKTTFAENFGAINAANLKRAHAFIESGRARGKIVLAGF